MLPISKANPRLLRFLKQRPPAIPLERHGALGAYLERRGYKRP